VLREPGLVAAARIAAATGTKLLAEVFPTRMERGAGLPAVERVAYLAELASVQLAGLKHLILVDAKAPVSFFAYPGKRSYLVPTGARSTSWRRRRRTRSAASRRSSKRSAPAARSRPARRRRGQVARPAS